MAHAKHSFHSMLLIVLLCVALIPLLVGVAVNLGVQKTILYNGIHDELENRTQSISAHLDSTIAKATTIIESLSSDPTILGFFLDSSKTDVVSKSSLVYSRLYSAKAAVPHIEITVARLDGLLFSTSEPIAEYDPTQYSNWGIIRQSLLVDGVVFYPQSWNITEPSSRFASVSSVHRTDGKADGIVIIDLMAPLLSRYLDGNANSFSIAVLDSLDTYCYRSPNWNSLESSNINFTEAVATTESGLKIMARMPLTMMDTTIKTSQILFGILLGVTTVVALVVSIVLSKRMSFPISVLVDGIRKIQDGDLKTKCNLQTNILELDALGNDIDLTSGRIEALIKTNEEKEKSLRQSMLKSLEAEIHPHFIFNSLGVIQQAVCLNDRATAIDIISKLAKLLRNSLLEQNVVPLSKEIETARSYLAIQSYRFESRLEYTIEFEDWVLNSYRIPKMAIQTLVENSIVHNIDKIDHPLKIDISGRFHKGSLNIIVSDNGEGISEDVIRDFRTPQSLVGDDSHGHGLQNTDRRLKLFYGPECGLVINNLPSGGVSIEMRLRQEALDE